MRCLKRSGISVVFDLFASEAIPEEGMVTANPERASHLRT